MKLISAAALILALTAGSAYAQAEKPLQLDAKTQTPLQIRVAPIRAAQSSSSVNAFATVVDATPLLTLLSDLATAQSAYNASQAEAARTQNLAKDDTVSQKTADAALAQARGDQAKVTLLKQRLGLEWGAWFSNQSDVALRQLAATWRTARLPSCASIRRQGRASRRRRRPPSIWARSARSMPVCSELPGPPTPGCYRRD